VVTTVTLLTVVTTVTLLTVVTTVTLLTAASSPIVAIKRSFSEAAVNGRLFSLQQSKIHIFLSS
jgi:hypothetical protein